MMRIKQVDTFIVSQKLEKPFSFSQWEYDRRSACLVRITTDSGEFGWGEGYGPAGVVKAGIEFLAPLITGKDPLHEASLWEQMHQRSLDFARRGVLVASLSALDVALWDLKGKILGQPVSVLLGGRRRDRVRPYATGMYFTEGPGLPQRLAAEARGYASQGFTAMKMKIGLSLKEDVANIRAVREAIGPDIGLMVDANHAFSRTEAVEYARAMEPFAIGWFEEPLSPEDYEGYTELRHKTAIPIAAGESEYLCAGFRHLAGNRCVDIAQPDICGAGGLTETRRIAALCHAYGVNLTPHCWGTGIAFATALHFTSALDIHPGRLRRAEPLLEMDRTENPLRDELVKPRFQLKDGLLDVSLAPGLGIEVDAGLLERFGKES